LVDAGARPARLPHRRFAERLGRVRRPFSLPWILATLVIVASCVTGEVEPLTEGVASTTTPTTTADPPMTTTAPATTVDPPMTTTASTTATNPPTTTTAATTTVDGLPFVQQIEIGRSLQDRPIVATERGTPGGTVVLVIGVIHGDEDAGIAIVDDLRELDVPIGIDLWLIEAINPDGVAGQVRGNANGVDLNRNFPHDWQPLNEPGHWQYSGSGPASEPETRAVVDFVSTINPALTVWYHQDLFRVSPGQGLDGLIRARYAELTGLPVLRVTGGTYTGVAATWQRQTFPDSIAFIVELGDVLPTDDARRHAAAVLDIAQLIADQPAGTSP
jgi:protein MpaA